MMTNQMDRKNEDLHETPQNQYLHHHNFAIERRGRECKQGAIFRTQYQFRRICLI